MRLILKKPSRSLTPLDSKHFSYWAISLICFPFTKFNLTEEKNINFDKVGTTDLKILHDAKMQASNWPTRFNSVKGFIFTDIICFATCSWYDVGGFD